jgi:cysteine desulfurase
VSIYLDHNATSPIRPEAEAAVVNALRLGGNPSSVHAAGRAARAAVETSRTQVAALVGAPSSSVVFTSGGAEANATALESAVAAGARRLIVSAIEHETVAATARASAVEVEVLPVDSNGVSDLGWLAARLGRWTPADGRPFVALMLANNETGVIQPIAEATALVAACGGWLHVDGVQAAGKMPIDFRALGAETLSLSAHKIGGPQGAGALIVGAKAALKPRLLGGGQERNRRAGTENVGGIAGFGAAAEAARRDMHMSGTQAEWRDAVEARLVREAGVTVMGRSAPRLANTLCFAVPGFASELQVMQMDLDGFMVSAGAACSSGKVKVSHVLAAMGQGELAGSALRISGGWNSTAQDWNSFADAWLEAFTRHQARRRQPAA